MATTPVRWFHSGMANAPVLRGQVGALIELLDACLINGFDTRTINTLVVSGGVATATISAGHGYLQHAVVRIAGATPADLNGDWRIKSVTASQLTFDCPGIADGSATGTITVMNAPAGWTKPFSGTSKAVYRSADLLSTRFYLRVDDADARYSRVRGYESMTDVDTGADLFPTIAQLAATAFTWPKSDVASTAARRWALIADGRTIHFLPAWYGAAPAAQAQHEYLRFGDFPSYATGDPFACCIAAAPSAAPLFNGYAGVNSEQVVGGAGGCYLARARSGVAGAIRHIHACATVQAGLGAAEANSADRLVPLYLLDHPAAAESTLRGVVPGAYLVYSKKSTDVGYLHDVTTTSDYMYVRTGRGDQTSLFAFMCFDVLGPW